MAMTTQSSLTGFFKEQYDKLLDAIPASTKMQKLVPFISRDKVLGKLYHSAIILAGEQGVTYMPGDDSGTNLLEDAIPMRSQDAQVNGAQITIRGQLSYSAAARSVSSKQAFESGTKSIVLSMMKSIRKRVELCILYGQYGIGKVASSSNQSATSTRLTIMSAHWADAIWSGLENTSLNFYNSTSLISSGSDAVFSISSVDPANKYVTVTGTATGITALDTAISGNPNTIDAFFKGSYGVEPVGLKKQLSTASGSIFNISVDSYSLWKSNILSTSGQMTYGKIQQAVAVCASRGLDENVVVLLNPKNWINVADSLIAARRFPDSNPKGKVGFSSLEFEGPAGSVEVIPHIYVKEGDMFILPPEQCERPGAVDVTFNRPGSNGEIFFDVPSATAYEFRGYSDQAFICLLPAKAAIVTGIVPVVVS